MSVLKGSGQEVPHVEVRERIADGRSSHEAAGYGILNTGGKISL
jgi:hypothetical protein